MSQYPPSPPPPPPYGAPEPRRQRPRPVWFVVGAVLVVLAPIAFVGALFFTLRPLTREDDQFTVADTPRQLSLPADEERALFTEGGHAVACDVTDGSGNAVTLESPGGEFSYNEWAAVARFETGDG